MRALLLSDPHYDFVAGKAAQAWYAEDPGPVDAVVVAGDVANEPGPAKDFFRLLKRFDVPKFAVPGNHDYWWGPRADRRYRTAEGFHGLAREAGFHVPHPDKLFEVVDGVLLFNLFYHSGVTPEDIAYTNDVEFFNVRGRIQNPTVEAASRVRLSISHLAPHHGIPTAHQQRHPMFYNTDIDAVLRAHQSPVHLFGHTHEHADATIDGVRYVNRPVGDYTLPTGPLSSFVVDLAAGGGPRA